MYVNGPSFSEVSIDPDITRYVFPNDARHSNPDSGIDSSRNRHSTSDRMNQFLSDTIEQSKKMSQGEKIIRIHSKIDDHNVIPASQAVQNYAHRFLELAKTWPPSRSHQHGNQSHSSAPPLLSDMMKEGPRHEAQPHSSRFSNDRLTPREEILRERNARLPGQKKTDYTAPLHSHTRRASGKTDYDMHHRSRSGSNRSCNSSHNCCHHTTVYQYNCPNDFKYAHHHDKRKLWIPTIQKEDDEILENLMKIKKSVVVSGRVAAKTNRIYDYTS